MYKEYHPSNLFKCDEWYKKDEEKSKSQTEENIAKRVKLRRQKLNDEDLFDMPLIEGGEEVKAGKGLKSLIPNKLLTRLPILLVQIKAGNNLNKLRNEIRQKLYLLHQHNKINNKSLQQLNHGRKHDCDKRFQNLLF